MNSQKEMKIASIFTDNMILQRDFPIRIFGTGDGSVTVNFLDETVTTISKDGLWCVSLSPREYGGPYDMNIDLNGNTLCLTNILIGDVFLACGQSNMEFPLFKTESGFDDSVHCKNENIRYYTVPRRYKKGENNCGFHFEDVYIQEKPWAVCDTESALHFSAIGHYFAEYIQRETQIPVGIISCNWGGRRIETFLKKTYFTGVPSLEKQIQEFEAYKAELDMEKYEKEYAEFLVRLKTYLETRLYDTIGINRRLGPYAAVAKMDIAEFPQPPKGPYDSTSPSTLWDTMFAEIVPFGVKALLWYQGESNSDDAEYTDKYLMFLKCLREEFDCNMDAYAVELASWMQSNKSFKNRPMDYFETEPSWAYLREQQHEATVRGERNYLVTSQELGDMYDIHPKRKKELAHRLAKKVLKHTFGMDIPADQPVYHSVEFEDGKAYITLDNSEGLYGDLAYVGMYIAGADHVLHEATVKILPDNRLCVYSAEVSEPVLVRYGYCKYYFGQHIYNNAGLPLAPFRTDKNDLSNKVK